MKAAVGKSVPRLSGEHWKAVDVMDLCVGVSVGCGCGCRLNRSLSDFPDLAVFSIIIDWNRYSVITYLSCTSEVCCFTYSARLGVSERNWAAAETIAYCAQRRRKSTADDLVVPMSCDCSPCDAGAALL